MMNDIDGVFIDKEYLHSFIAVINSMNTRGIVIHRSFDRRSTQHFGETQCDGGPPKIPQCDCNEEDARSR